MGSIEPRKDVNQHQEETRMENNMEPSEKISIGNDLLYRDEVYAIIGAAMEVLLTLGRGFLEQVYQEALAIEFSLRGIPFIEQKEMPIVYKGRELDKQYFVDFLAYEKIVIEIKSVDKLNPAHEAQLLNYLKASDIKLGLLINFNSSRLEWKRMILTPRSSIET